MSEPRDIIAAIDHATGCQQCGGDLSGSVSDDFCSEECQRAWQAAHVARVDQDEQDAYDSGFGTFLASTLRASVRDVTFSLPTYTPGAMVHEIRSATVYVADGDEWEPIGELSNGVRFTTGDRFVIPVEFSTEAGS